MNTSTLTLKTIASIVLSTLMAFSLPVFAQRDVIDDLRGRQAEIALERHTVREQVEMLQDYLDQGRTVFVFLPLSGLDAWDMVTMREAMKVWTFEYLEHIARENKPFSSAGLAALIKARRDKAVEATAALERTVKEWRARGDQLDKKWKELEAQIAALQAPPLPTPPKPPKPPGSVASGPAGVQAGNRDCVEYAGVERLFDLGKAASVEANAGSHSASHGGAFQGHPTNGTVTWTAPPRTLCVGDEFVIEMNAENAAPKYKSGAAYVAAVSVHPTSRALEIVSCSNPPRGFGPSNNSAAVNSPMTSYTNTCTYRVKSVNASKAPKGYIAADLTATPSYGKVTYLYRVR